MLSCTSAMQSISTTLNWKTKPQNETVASCLVEIIKQFLLLEPFLACPEGYLRAARAIPASQLRWSPIDLRPFLSHKKPWTYRDHRYTLESYLRWLSCGWNIHILQPDARKIDSKQPLLQITKSKCIQCNISVDTRSHVDLTSNMRFTRQLKLDIAKHSAFFFTPIAKIFFS